MRVCRLDGDHQYNATHREDDGRNGPRQTLGVKVDEEDELVLFSTNEEDQLTDQRDQTDEPEGNTASHHSPFVGRGPDVVALNGEANATTNEAEAKQEVDDGGGKVCFVN